jgi:hypothetical protein
MTKPKRGGYRKTEFTERIKNDPIIAAVDLRAMWILTKSATKAAKLLGISRRSFFRCVDRLEALGFDVRRPSETANPGIDTVRS